MTYDTSPRLDTRRDATSATATVRTAAVSTPTLPTSNSATVGTLVGSTVRITIGRYQATAAALTTTDSDAGANHSKERFCP